MATPKNLPVSVMSYFRVGGAAASRWRPDKSYPVKRAVLTVLESSSGKSAQTLTVGKYGTGKLDTSSIARR